MTRGLLLLVARSALESRIIASFLEAADYQVADYTSLSLQANPQLMDYNAGVLVMENENSDLTEMCARVREFTHREGLPLVAVVTQPNAGPIEGLRVLVRPIRLFDLVRAVDQLIDYSEDDDSTGLRDRQTVGA